PAASYFWPRQPKAAVRLIKVITAWNTTVTNRESSRRNGCENRVHFKEMVTKIESTWSDKAQPPDLNPTRSDCQPPQRMIKDVCFNDRERCSTSAACDAHYERGICRNCINARGWTESMQSRNFGRDRRRLNDVQAASASIDGSVLYHSQPNLASQ